MCSATIRSFYNRFPPRLLWPFSVRRAALWWHFGNANDALVKQDCCVSHCLPIPPDVLLVKQSELPTEAASQRSLKELRWTKKTQKTICLNNAWTSNLGGGAQSGERASRAFWHRAAAWHTRQWICPSLHRHTANIGFNELNICLFEPRVQLLFFCFFFPREIFGFFL